MSFFDVTAGIVKAGLAQDFIAAWVKISRRIGSLEHPFAQKYHGLVHNVLQWLYYLGWKPHTPFVWTDYENNRWEFREFGFSNIEIIRKNIDIYN